LLGFYLCTKLANPPRGATENARLELSAPNCGVENAGPSSYGKQKHVVVAAHRKSSVQLFVGINNVANAFILVA